MSAVIMELAILRKFSDTGNCYSDCPVLPVLQLDEGRVGNRCSDYEEGVN